MTTIIPKSSNQSVTALPFLALVIGAVAMGASPVFVRFAEIGPVTSAFYRMALALPPLLLWLWFAEPNIKQRQWRQVMGGNRFAILAGLVFAGDLLFWHLAIVNTTIANATFMATMAPVWVLLLSGVLLGERVGRSEITGLSLCLLGGVALAGGTMSLNPDNLRGDIFGIITSVFFGLYFLCVRRARREGASTAFIMAISSLVTCAVLAGAAFALEDQWWPMTLTGVAALFALAMVSQVGGQGLLAYALGHVPAAFSSLVIFMEAVAAAALGWLVLGEGLTVFQWLGGATIFVGVAIARPRA